MILYFHKIDPRTPPTRWWMTPRALYQLCCDLRSYRVVALDDYDPNDLRHIVLTFDGVYENAVRYGLPVLEHFGYPSEWFVTGDLIGKDNAFDRPEPPALFAGWGDLHRLVGSDSGARLQWHTRTHADLTTLDQAALDHELAIPDGVRGLDARGFRWLAYPHGRVPSCTFLGDRGYAGAVACENGDDFRYALARTCALEGMRLDHPTVTLIIPNYNYARFLHEAVDSALVQTCQADELLVIDDASTDHSLEVLASYAGRVTVHRNPTNLGIVDNFRLAVDLTQGDFIAFLGADNRARADYLERTTGALIAHPKAAVAYTDLALFGPRADLLAGKIGAKMIGTSGIFLWQFPNFDENLRTRQQSYNSMHGSSLYRRAAYDAVEGYRSGHGPEDHDLFRRMVANGWDAVRVPHPLIEYRQHGDDQANARYGG